ncbi:MAG: hypothetical protein ACEPOV_01260 [Hyphomicrobiales bacterium]
MKNSYATIRSIPIVLFLAFILSPILSIAQNNGENVNEIIIEETTDKSYTNFDPYWFIRGNIGTNIYYGDLAKNKIAPDFKRAKLAATLGGGYQFTPWFALEGQLNAGSFSGEKTKNFIDRSFYSNTFGGSINTRWNIWNAIFRYKEHRVFTIDALLGIGQTNFKSTLLEANTGSTINKYGRKSSLILPVGLLWNFKINNHFTAQVESDLVFVGTDKFDGISIPANKGIDNDRYAYVGVGLQYAFNSSNSLKKMKKNFEKSVHLKAYPEVLEEIGDSIPVRIEGKISPRYVGKNAVVNLTPILSSDLKAVAYPSINLIGEKVVGDGIKISYKNGGSFVYEAKIPYDDALSFSELTVTPLFYTFKDVVHKNRDEVIEKENSIEGSTIKLADGVLHTSKMLESKGKTALSPHGYGPVTMNNAAELYFRINTSKLSWKLPLNKQKDHYMMLANLTEKIRLGWKVRDITITGFASPDGPVKFNKNLSHKRAMTAKSYLYNKIKREMKNKKYHIRYKKTKDIIIETSFKGPDWIGLMDVLSASSFVGESEVMDIFNSDMTMEEKAKMLKPLIDKYPDLKNKYLPPLRRAFINIITQAPMKPLEEIKMLAKTAPDSLSMEELLFAASETVELETKKGIYFATIEAYPDNWRAYNNAGALEIETGDIDNAIVLLEKAKELNPDAGEIYANLGIVEVLMGNFKGAEDLFNKAQTLGVDENYNQGIIALYKGDYAKASQLLQEFDCTLNLGLAQLLNKDYKNAEKTLKCSPRGPSKHYLLAILFARQGDDKKVFRNLMKVVKENPELKANIATDQEFRMYFNTPEFKMIISE